MGRTGRIYRKIRARLVDQPGYFSWIDDKVLSASSLPSSDKQVAWLAKNGVKTILTLTEDPLRKEWLEKNGIKGAHIPMSDHQSPTIDQLKEAVVFIQTELDARRPVHVHCLAGIGRTGTVLAAFLMNSKGVSIEEAIRSLRTKRPNSVESPQEAFLIQHENELKQL